MICSSALPPGAALRHLLTPPPGAQLKLLIAATYTLSPTVLLELAAALHYSVHNTGGYDCDDLCLDLPQILRTAGDRLRVFTGAGLLASSRLPAAVGCNAAALFQTCGTVIRPENGGLFHPKLLLACFRGGGEGSWSYRLQIGSGNLTKSGGLDLAVQLESAEAGGNGPPNGAQLAPFIRQLFRQDIPELEALASLSFLPCRPSKRYRHILRNISPEDIRFACNLPDKRHRGCLQALAEDFGSGPVQIYSPFLSPDKSGAFYLDGILKNAAYYTNLTQALLSAQHTPAAGKIFCSTSENPFLHAKLYCQEREGQTRRVWLGSANASAGGMERNVELMVGFTLEAPAAGCAQDSVRSEDASPALLRRDGTLVQFLPLSGCNDTQCHPSDGDLPQARAWMASFQGEASPCAGGFQLTLAGGPLPQGAALTVYPLNRTAALLTLASPSGPVSVTVRELPPYGQLRAELLFRNRTFSGTIPLAYRGGIPPELTAPEPEPVELEGGVTLYRLFPPGPFRPASGCLLERLEAYLAGTNGSPEGIRNLILRIGRVRSCLSQELAKWEAREQKAQAGPSAKAGAQARKIGQNLSRLRDCQAQLEQLEELTALLTGAEGGGEGNG